jgi:hypothetical protein
MPPRRTAVALKDLHGIELERQLAGLRQAREQMDSLRKTVERHGSYRDVLWRAVEVSRVLEEINRWTELLDPQTLQMARLLSEQQRIDRRWMDGMIESMLPRKEVPSPVAVLQARRNAEARQSLLEEFGALTSQEIADLAQSKARNRAALANRWKQEGKIFSVHHQGQTYFPAFEFDPEGRPHPVVERVIELLGESLSEWELALWFTGSNGWLGGRRPVDLLASEPESVVGAAEREAAGFVF